MLTITNFFSKLQNAYKRKKPFVAFPYSNISLEIAKQLKKEGFIRRFDFNVEKRILLLVLQYRNGLSPIQKIQLYSTCSRSIFWQLSDFPLNGFYILSTSKGILSRHEALKQQTGGKVLCRII